MDFKGAFHFGRWFAACSSLLGDGSKIRQWPHLAYVSGHTYPAAACSVECYFGVRARLGASVLAMVRQLLESAWAVIWSSVNFFPGASVRTLVFASTLAWAPAVLQQC